MRKLSLLVLVLLVAASLGACKSSHPDTYTNVTGATQAGKTVTGKVVSFTDSTVTIETVTGQETLGLTSNTSGRDLRTVGARLGFAFERSSGRGEPVVTMITANPSEAEPH
jgi:hypothetical protein